MISYLKNKYYWCKINQRLRKFLMCFSDQKILMYGYPKSGNTWLRFLIFNYRNLLLDPMLGTTMTYDRLNEVQNNVMDKGTAFPPEDGFPFFYRTHKSYTSSYDFFSFKIFIHRNPMDTLISSYYFYKERDVAFSDDSKEIRDSLHDIDFYVKHKLDSWIRFYYDSLKHADIVINYSDLKEDCFLIFSGLIKELGWNYNDDLIQKSIKISSFDKIKKMGKIKNQKYGNGPKDGSFKGEFTRSGEEGQFRKELKIETIRFVLEKFPDFRILYPNCLDIQEKSSSSDIVNLS